MRLGCAGGGGRVATVSSSQRCANLPHSMTLSMNRLSMDVVGPWLLHPTAAGLNQYSAAAKLKRSKRVIEATMSTSPGTSTFLLASQAEANAWARRLEDFIAYTRRQFW